VLSGDGKISRPIMLKLLLFTYQAADEI